MYKKFLLIREKLGISGWFGTGDLGCYDTDGNIFIAERMNQIFYVKKCIILPTLIENMLQFHHAVFEAIVTYISINNNDRYAVALIEKMPGKQV